MTAFAKQPEDALAKVLTTCADCDTCRFLMDESCLLFPRLYALADRQQQQGQPVCENELQQLADLCTLCGLCPCPDIRADVIRGKARRFARQGLPLALRLLADPQSLGIWNERLRGLPARILRWPLLQRLGARIAAIHPRRRLPPLAVESFFTWARRAGLNRPNPASSQTKVAYFAGCTAAYFFPQVARAAVTLLQQHQVTVYVPPQQCCGMPTLVEGASDLTNARMRFNLETLLQCVRAGYTPVCSCPTCGFLMKRLLQEKAVYADACQQALGAAAHEIRVPAAKGRAGTVTSLQKSIYGRMLQDDGYFAALDPRQRLRLADSIVDLGEYLVQLRQNGRLHHAWRRIEGRMVYFAPCHQREQGIGNPYMTLLKQIPGLEIQQIGGVMDCCGMGGSLGYKAGFYDASLRLGQPLMAKIDAATPEAIVTDCLSCRLQFQHALPYAVFHPLELLGRACAPSHTAA